MNCITAPRISKAAILKKAPSFAKQVHSSGARREGLLYQKSVNERFEQMYGTAYVRDPWFSYELDGVPKICSPDGLLVSEAKAQITIVEIKRTHTSAAFTQLRQKYLPVLRCAFGGAAVESQGAEVSGSFPLVPWHFALVEVAPAYDFLDSGGETVSLIRYLDQAVREEVAINFLPMRRFKRKFK